MAQELVKALIQLTKHCFAQGDCKTCALRDFCGQPVSQWGDQ